MITPLFFQIFRHGQRVPIEFYPNDPYANLSFWEASPGQLTKVIHSLALYIIVCLIEIVC